VEVGASAQLYATAANVAGVFRQMEATAHIYSPDGALAPAARAIPLHTAALSAATI